MKTQTTVTTATAVTKRRVVLWRKLSENEKREIWKKNAIELEPRLQVGGRVGRNGGMQMVSIVLRKGNFEAEDSTNFIAESEPPEESTKVSAPSGKKDSKPTKVVTSKLVSANTVNSMKKTMKSKRGRVGRNQYTRDRDGDNRESPPPSRDSDGAGNGETTGTLLANGSKPARPRHINPNRTSMNELRKRAAGILEFISRTQIEIAGEHTPSGGNSVRGESSKTGPTATGLGNGASKLSTEIGEEPQSANADEVAGKGQEEGSAPGVDELLFKEMNSLQMMDVLTREIVLWQKQHGKWGERL